MPAKTYEDYKERLKKTQPGAVVATEKEWNKIKQRQSTTYADTWLEEFRPAVKKEIAKQKKAKIEHEDAPRTQEQISELKKAGLTDKEIAKLRGQGSHYLQEKILDQRIKENR